MKAEESTPLLGSDRGMYNGPPAGPIVAGLRTSVDGRQDENPTKFPQAIAHRGYKVAFPENSMAAFRSAVEVGAHAIETDLHLSADGVVVLSHDATLKRCFDVDKKVADCDWSYLSTLRTVREPSQPLPRLLDLLEYLAQPEQENIWVLLDIKKDDDPSELLTRLATTIASVPAKRPWTERVMIGCWDANYIKLALKLLPGFPITYIGFELAYAAALLAVPNMNFNLLQQSVTGRCGAHFLRTAEKAGRAVFVWTVNDESWMEWDIRKGLDGVVTDDPKLFLEVCDRWKGAPGDSNTTSKSGGTQRPPWSKPGLLAHILIYNILLVIYKVYMLTKGGTAKQRVKKAFKTL